MSVLERLNSTKEFIKNSRVTQLTIALVAGVAVGAIFYPTKRIEETVRQKYEEQLKTEKEVHAAETKTLSEQVNALSGSLKKVTEEKDHKINTLTTQVRELKNRKVTNYYKIVRPDGTVEIKKYTESESEESNKIVTQIQEEFKQKVESIENKWESIHKTRVQQLQKDFKSKEATYQTKIAELESRKVTDINPKKFGIEVGAVTTPTLGISGYVHPTADLAGPLFIGLHGQIGASSQLGLGLGLKF